MTSQTPLWGPPPQRPGFWARLSPIQRVGLIAAALVLPCCGGAAVAGALSGDPKPAIVETPAAAEAGAVGDAPVEEPTTESVTVDPAATGSSDATPAPLVTTKAVTKKTVKVTKSVAFATKKVDDDNLAEGKTKVTTKGVAGVRTLTYEVTMTGGKETGRKLISDTVTKKPVTKVIAVGTKPASNGCDPNYTPCVPIASDVDCAGGSGNGPAYVDGPVTVVGSDIYDLDRDGDGTACDS
ncbi:G5 domain-containing protein [Actinoplanes sp. CA-142083]|uniref:G5 domain-containing protein n=1 Tax=Actinoplanes sp. CA-142083 TaxID=3239903 RepID=UPI003D92C1D4